MKIRYKLLAGLLGMPIIFSAVTAFLIVTNRKVQNDTQKLANFHMQLEIGAAHLHAALISGQKAAEELIAEKNRARAEPADRDAAERAAIVAIETIRKSQGQFDEILASLIKVTQHSLDEAREQSHLEAALEDAEELERLALIRQEADYYNLRMETFLAAVDTEIDEADEILNKVEHEYEQKMLPLVQNYAAAREFEVNKEASKIEESMGQMSRLVALSAVGTLLFAVLIALFLSRSFSRPLKQLASAAMAIGKGQLGSTIQIKSRDEIGLLAKAFNQMRDDLSRTTVSRDYVDGIIKSMGDSLVVASSESRILTVNAATCRMLGYTEGELIGQPLQTLFVNYDEVLNHQPHSTDIVTNCESDYLAKDGSHIPVAFSCTQMPFGNDQAPGMVCVAKDITELKRAAEALRQSEHKLSLHIQQTPLAVIEWNLNAEIVEWNPAAKDLFGYSKEEVLGRQILGLLVPDSAREQAVQEWNELLAEKVGKHVTHLNLTKDGRTIVCEWYNTPLESEGRVIGVASMIQDFTERAEMEKELRKARDAALESARLKSEFLANMSHEIRTPMNGIIGMTGILLDTELNDEQREFAETIRTSGDALLTIINDILDFSKIEAGQLKFEKLDFELSNAIESTLELFAERAYAKRIEVASLVYRDVPTGLRGDPGRLRQVLTNLIGNAIKFTDHGEVIVRAEKEKESDDYVVIRFAVSDTGIGIGEAAQQHLFQAFRQADGSTTRKYGGTGLGLAISKQLVELMDGEIGVTSASGKGSTFWFTAKFGKQTARVAAPEPNLESLSGLHALIVDDNATNRKILHHQLSSWGMTSEEADSGARALELLRSAAAQGKAYDLAVCDLMMPGMDGFELARTIKSDPTISQVTLVLLTSYGQRGDSTIAREAGVSAYLTKPVRQSQLFECLATVMCQRNDASDAIITRTESKLITRHTLAEKKPMSNKLILLAEDNIVNQKVAVRQLRQLGYRADAVADGREALEALSRIPYDLVLMDCQMPEMDGYEATAEIRRREGTTKHTPIVAMTAHALEGERTKCIAAGMDDYISKPVSPEALQEVLERLLESPPPTVNREPELSEEALPPVDLDRLHRALGDDPEEVAEILDIYLSHMSKSLKELDAAIKAGDAAAVDLIAHNCGGTSANCGMNAVVAPLRELEAMGRENKLIGAAALAGKATREFERIKLFLQENLQLTTA